MPLSDSPSLSAPLVQSTAAFLSANSSRANKSGSITTLDFFTGLPSTIFFFDTFLPRGGPAGSGPLGGIVGPLAIGGPVGGLAPGGPLDGV